MIRVPASRPRLATAGPNGGPNGQGRIEKNRVNRYKVNHLVPYSVAYQKGWPEDPSPLADGFLLSSPSGVVCMSALYAMMTSAMVGRAKGRFAASRTSATPPYRRHRF
jgi:hypothetical protein